MEYKKLNINEKINFKGLVGAWSNITIERFQAQIDKKVYGRRRRGLIRGSEQRDAKGRYVKGSGKYRSVRTYKLRSDWRKRLYLDASNGGVKGLQLSFLLYGRFVDMGVGKGKDFALSRWQRKRRNGESSARTPARWYSREKGYQVHRLRELLAKYYVNITLSSLEQVLTDSVTVHV
ncbi:hypothetical protein [Spirosoma sp.]|uniref:hypothetical protein n=1 Tax=Spirosoma sp. TaxID=1899569 RepID=UPI00262A38C4|nr:hypothetical protein [Spirosoma sp.]MCX6216508.1 hypothetical protein [Spirosoma sp.]